MSIGNRLNMAFSSLNLTTKDIVEKFDISQQYVSNLKKAEKMNDTIASIALEYNINVNWLLTGIGDMFLSRHINQSNANIHGNASGVDFSGNKHINSASSYPQIEELSEYHRSLLFAVLAKYKNDKKSLEEKLLKILSDV